MKTPRRVLQPLEGSPSRHDSLIERFGHCRFVLLGEASHVTHDFYAARAAITRRLITEKGFGTRATRRWAGAAS